MIGAYRKSSQNNEFRLPQSTGKGQAGKLFKSMVEDAVNEVADRRSDLLLKRKKQH